MNFAFFEEKKNFFLDPKFCLPDNESRRRNVRMEREKPKRNKWNKRVNEVYDILCLSVPHLQNIIYFKDETRFIHLRWVSSSVKCSWNLYSFLISFARFVINSVHLVFALCDTSTHSNAQLTTINRSFLAGHTVILYIYIAINCGDDTAHGHYVDWLNAHVLIVLFFLCLCISTSLKMQRSLRWKMNETKKFFFG